MFPYTQTFIKTPINPFIKPEHGLALLLSSFILALTLINQSWNNFVFIADQTIIIDLSLMTTAWNTSNITYDLNKDGRVNSLDYVMMVRNWTV